MAVRASKPRYVHSSAVSRCEGETSFNQIQVGGQGGRSEASRWGKPSVCAGTRRGPGRVPFIWLAKASCWGFLPVPGLWDNTSLTDGACLAEWCATAHSIDRVHCSYGIPD